MIEFLEQNNNEKKPKYSYEELKQKYIDEEKVTYDHKLNVVNDYNIIITFVISIIIFIGLGIFLGKYVDELLNTKPLFILLFVFIGIGAAYRNMYLSFKKRDKKRSPKDE